MTIQDKITLKTIFLTLNKILLWYIENTFRVFQGQVERDSHLTITFLTWLIVEKQSNVEYRILVKILPLIKREILSIFLFVCFPFRISKIKNYIPNFLFFLYSPLTFSLFLFSFCLHLIYSVFLLLYCKPYYFYLRRTFSFTLSFRFFLTFPLVTLWHYNAYRKHCMLRNRKIVFSFLTLDSNEMFIFATAVLSVRFLALTPWTPIETQVEASLKILAKWSVPHTTLESI